MPCKWQRNYSDEGSYQLMSLFGKIRDIMGVEDEEDFDQEDEYMSTPQDYDDMEMEHDDYVGYDDKSSNKVVNMNNRNQLQVVLVKPERFDDASAIADHLNAKRTVVLNLESTNKEVSRRLVDFLSGVAYANNGQIKRVANNTFIITPYNVDVVGDLLDELENNGIFF